MRLLVLAALAAAFSIAPTNAQPQPKEPDLATRVRELEERLAQVERKLSIPQEDLIPLGDITVNLAEDRLQRYLRVKVVIKVDVKDHRQMQAAVAVRRAELKSWAISLLLATAASLATAAAVAQPIVINPAVPGPSRVTVIRALFYNGLAFSNGVITAFPVAPRYGCYTPYGNPSGLPPYLARPGFAVGGAPGYNPYPGIWRP